LDLLPLISLSLGVLLCVTAFRRAFVVWRETHTRDVSVQEDRDAAWLAELLERKELIMGAIRSTKLDLATSKISQEDHDKTVKRLELDAVRVMRSLDEIRGAEDDLGAADAELDRLLVRARDARDTQEEGWSPAARLRHGGQRPAATEGT